MNIVVDSIEKLRLLNKEGRLICLNIFCYLFLLLSWSQTHDRFLHLYKTIGLNCPSSTQSRIIHLLMQKRNKNGG